MIGDEGGLPTLVASLTVATTLAISGGARADAHETVVFGSRSNDGDARVDGDDVVGSLDGSTLKGAAGVSLRRDGGPLSPARPLLRGVGGPRVAVDVAGLPFGDSAGGDIDATLLPWALGLGVVDVGGDDDTIGGRVSLRPAPGSRFFALTGSLSTLVVGGRASVPLEDGRAVVALDAGSTRGDYPFLATDALGSPGIALIRRNNDQRVLRGATVVDVARAAPEAVGGQVAVRVAAAVAQRDGGVPGFATAPLLDLRRHDGLGALGATLSHRDGPRQAHLRLSGSGSDRATTTTGAPPSQVSAGMVDAELGVADAVHVGDVDVSGHADVSVGSGGVWGVAERRRGHVSGGVRTTLPLHEGVALAVDVGGRVASVVDADLGGDDVDNVDEVLLPAGHVSGRFVFSAGPSQANVGLRVSSSSRAPTLDERFAPAGFVRGNQALRPERGSDVEASVGMRHDRLLSLRAAAFASLLDDAIVVVNRNAFEVAPENTGPATRAGVELQARLQPWPLLRVDHVASLLASEVSATKAPLPGAPTWTLLSALRLGDEHAFAQASVDARGSSPSTIFGTLNSPAYALVHLRGRVPVDDAVCVDVAVDNAFDMQDARDANLLPLPGRLFFVSLEVRL